MRRTGQLIAGSIFAVAVPATVLAQDGDRPVQTALIEGRCGQLVIAGEDRSAGCRGAVVNVRYRSGRFSFIFMEAGGMTSFSGTRVLADGGENRLILDRITMVSGSHPDTLVAQASGSCSFSSLAEAGTIACRGRAGSGEFSAAFVSLGPPSRVVED